jgi:hypothetical protein
MITNDGKEIIAKTLLGQVPRYATHIACGCGGTPLNPSEIQTEEELDLEKEKKTLDFETFRVPITSRGLIKEDGQEKIVFKGEMPTEQRFLVSEVAIFPGSANTVAGQYDSKTLFTLIPNETWVLYSTTSSSVINVATSSELSTGSGSISIFDPAYYILSADPIFDLDDRALRQEPPRFYSHSLALSGSSSFIDNQFNIDPASFRVENASQTFDLSQNLPTDEVKLAISVLSRIASNSTNPETIRIVFDFVNQVPTDIAFIPPKARLNIEIPGTELDNRYQIITKNLSDFILDDNFSWANINLTRIYLSALNNIGQPTNDYIVSLDGVRVENISTPNPLYGMVAYSKIRSDNSLPIPKPANTNNFIEYRLNIGVG